ncbi:MAG: 3,4-dihydroxy-2-butanone-4-phosphate synthase [Crocinitomicaceae bacterium]|jgi:3,4-dihydroxy 2-butanone 4-phosphate synthase/GTP cyclohydrolase II|nr:3,4-dihydroxy-2-butanone-4-phosphate synthase [Crocinitomicaceae bacterium]MBK6952915.1 3,4-dihydroxy-2-butanone-4-phosphate synthase [Crocinitomicaceae bacterium]MBK9591167.1 3,4-dihydroxy-2-butanone-4-phosphate synthase [Crocinitomicaceae bacterium]
MTFKLHTIQEAIQDIRDGKIIIVVDDEDRENEGDFLTAARNVTPEIVNFMATHGRGLICAPLVEDECDRLGLELMVQRNSASYETPFTVSIDLIGHGCTTGISASDRAKTILALINPETKPEELGKPGHIFPLRAKKGGVLRRAGHTEAAIDLSRLAGFEAAGVIVEIMNEDGTMARLPELIEIAAKFNLKIVSIADLIAYRLKHESLIEKILESELKTIWGDFKLMAYRQTTTDEEHLAIVKGNWTENESVLVRVESSSFTNNLLDAIRSDKQSNLSAALQMIEKEGKGVMVFMQQEEKQIGLIDKLQAYNGQITKPTDNRDYGVGAQILRSLGIKNLKLITNNAQLNESVINAYGLEVSEIVGFMK